MCMRVYVPLGLVTAANGGQPGPRRGDLLYAGSSMEGASGGGLKDQEGPPEAGDRLCDIQESANRHNNPVQRRTSLTDWQGLANTEDLTPVSLNVLSY